MNDTHPQVDRLWIEMLRAAGPTTRARMASRLSAQSRWRVQRALAKSHPDLSETERKLLFLEIHHGRDVADRVRAYLVEKSRR